MASAAVEPRQDPRRIEQLIMGIIGAAIRERAEMPTNEAIAFRLGIGLSSVPTILRRLEERGLIKVNRFQRSRQVIEMRSGLGTAMPSNAAPHWRDRPPKTDVPTPSIDTIRRAKPDLAARILAAARAEGKDYMTFLADMVWAGFVLYEGGDGNR